jgi:hypothetical protein
MAILTSEPLFFRVSAHKFSWSIAACLYFALILVPATCLSYGAREIQHVHPVRALACLLVCRRNVHGSRVFHDEEVLHG